MLSASTTTMDRGHNFAEFIRCFYTNGTNWRAAPGGRHRSVALAKTSTNSPSSFVYHFRVVYRQPFSPRPDLVTTWSVQLIQRIHCGQIAILSGQPRSCCCVCRYDENKEREYVSSSDDRVGQKLSKLARTARSAIKNPPRSGLRSNQGRLRTAIRATARYEKPASETQGGRA